jgi:HEAT repeat protein
MPVILLLAIPTIGAFELPRFLTVWGKPGSPGVALAASPSVSAADSKNVVIEEIARLAPQQQAERLLELAANDDRKAVELIRQNLPNWRGRLQNTDQLFGAVLKALRSDDLRVRRAAVEIDLSANHLSKTPESLAWLQQVIRKDAARRSMALWRLGALGNRGVEPKEVWNTLVLYAHHVNLDTRYWAVEGLAMLASDEAIDPLLDVLRHDPSSRVRERAASALAQSGLFTKEQRLSAVPHLLNSLDDDGLDAKTRGCVLWTVRTITGATIGDDINAWREWWANHDGALRRLSSRPGLYRI